LAELVLPPRANAAIVLTPLQQRIAGIVSEAIVGTDIALAGGTVRFFVPKG